MQKPWNKRMTGAFHPNRIKFSALSWNSIFFITFLSVAFYSFMEWIFFVTKPSFMNSLSIWGKIKIWILTNFTLCAAFFIILLAFWGLYQLGKPVGVRKITLILAGIVPALILTITALLLFDNFTYTIFKFGVITSTGAGRGVYGAAFLAIVCLIFFQIQPYLEQKRNPSIRVWILSAVLGFSLILAIIMFPGNSASSALADTSKVTSKPNIILLGSDGITADNMSLYGYSRDTTPYLKSLAAGSLLMENHLTNSGNTSGSLMSIFTGKLTTQTRVIYPPDILQSADSYRHLPGILDQLGYHTVEIAIPHYLDSSTLNLKDGFDEVNEQMVSDNPFSRSVRTVMPDDVVYFMESLLERVTDRLGHIFYLRQMPDPYQVVTQPSAILDDEHRLAELTQIIQQDDGPFFVHVHLMGTHGGKFIPQSREFSSGEAQDQEWMTDFYDDAVLDFDGYVNRVVDALKATGKLDNTILLIYTDHAAQWVTTERIPLMIRFPNEQYAGTITSDTENLDIAPTLLDYMGIDQPSWMGGQSLLKEAPSTQRTIYSAGVGNIEDVGTGWWFYDQNSAAPPFYQFGFFTETVCQKWVKLTTADRVWTSGTLDGDSSPCPDDQLPSTPKMEADLLNRLKQDGFDVSSIKLTDQ
jgi:hypothetical protein